MSKQEPAIVQMEPVSEAQSLRIGAFLAHGIPSDDPTPARKCLAHWKLTKNPIFPGLAHVMVSSSGNEENLVSTFTVTPKPMWAWGKEAIWAEVGDTVTAPEFQRRGLFSRLHNSITASALEDGVETMYGLPNPNSFPAYVKKFKWLVKANANLISCTKVTGTTRVANMISARLPKSLAGRIAGSILKHAFLDKPVQLASRAWTRIQAQGDTEIEIISVFPEDFNELWTKVREHVSVSTLRNRQYLSWRFVENPFPFKIFSARRKGELVGYLVTHFEANKDSPYGRLWIADWICDPAAGKQVGSDLLRRALLEPQDGPVEVVSALSNRNSPFPLPWKKFGFIVRDAPKPLIFFPNACGTQAANDPYSWHFTLGDTDPF